MLSESRCSLGLFPLNFLGPVVLGPRSLTTSIHDRWRDDDDDDGDGDSDGDPSPACAIRSGCLRLGTRSRWTTGERCNGDSVGQKILPGPRWASALS